MINVVNIEEKFRNINSYWSPVIIGELNGQQVKAAKLKGDFPEHFHEYEDEMFLVIKGSLIIDFNEERKTINKGEFIVIPKGVRHKPIAVDEVHVLLFEPEGTLNTGNEINSFTQKDLKKDY